MTWQSFSAKIGGEERKLLNTMHRTIAKAITDTMRSVGQEFPTEETLAKFLLPIVVDGEIVGDIEKAIDDAIDRDVNDTISDMAKRGLVDLSLNADDEFVFSLSEIGKKVAAKL